MKHCGELWCPMSRKTSQRHFWAPQASQHLVCWQLACHDLLHSSLGSPVSFVVVWGGKKHPGKGHKDLYSSQRPTSIMVQFGVKHRVMSCLPQAFQCPPCRVLRSRTDICIFSGLVSSFSLQWLCQAVQTTGLPG